MKSNGPPLDATHFSLADQVRRIGKVMSTIIGVPDYDRYVEHAQTCHPDRPVMSREEFAKNRMDARYNQPGNRCC